MIGLRGETNGGLMTWFCTSSNPTTRRGTLMTSRTNSQYEQIDHKTSRSICDAVGERLQQSVRPDHSPSSHLQQLMDELRKRDNEAGPRSSN